ncbi:hypothetical protein Tco_1176216 [Tanacetum coccineum]
MAIEKLQLEAAQLEAKDATSALHKITEMSRELLRTTNLVLDADYDLDISSQNIPKIEVHDSKDRSFAELKIEVARLSDLTQKLIQDARIGEDYGVVYGSMALHNRYYVIFLIIGFPVDIINTDGKEWDDI